MKQKNYLILIIMVYFCWIAGVIDQDYRGNVGVILFIHSDEDFVIDEGDRVAQLTCEKIEYPETQEVKVRKIVLKIKIRTTFLYDACMSVIQQ